MCATALSSEEAVNKEAEEVLRMILGSSTEKIRAIKNLLKD